MLKYESLGQWHGCWTWVLFCAPDQFREVLSQDLELDQENALRNAFEELRSGFHFAERKLKNPRLSRIAAELIEMSLEAYLSGDKKTGAHVLQESEGIIWSGMRQNVKYGIEAEKRAFGENILYAGLVASQFPYEGTFDDLGPNQAALLALAMRWSRLFQAQCKEFKYFSWVVDTNGVIWRTSIEPKDDEHAVLTPVQRSWGMKRLRELGHNGEIRACVLMEISAPQGDGLVAYHLEELGRPRISAMQLFKRISNGVQYENARYHLDVPYILPGGAMQNEATPKRSLT